MGLGFGVRGLGFEVWGHDLGFLDCGLGFGVMIWGFELGFWIGVSVWGLWF